MNSGNKFLSSVLGCSNNLIQFSLNDQGYYTYYNEEYFNALKAAFNSIIKTGINILDLINDQEKSFFIKKLRKVLDGEVITEKVEISETERVFSLNWSPVFHNKTIVGVTVFGYENFPNSTREKKYFSRLNLFENLDKVNKAIQNSVSPEELIRNVFNEVFKIFDIDKAFFVYPCIPDVQAYKVSLISLTSGERVILRKSKEIITSPFVSEQLKILSEAEKPLMYGFGTERPLPSTFTEKFGLKTYIAITLRPKNDYPWLFGFSQAAPGSEWSDEMLCLLQEIGQRLSDGLGSILIFKNLQRREKENRAIVNAVPDLLFRVSKDGTIIDFKKPTFLNFNYKANDFIGKKISQIIPEEGCKKASAALKNALKNHTIELFEFDLIFDDKHYFVEARVIEMLKNEALFVVRNISDRVRAHRQLKKSELEFHSLVENLPSFVARFDLSGRFTYINNVALNAFLLTAEYFIGKTYLEIPPGENFQSNKALFDALLTVISTGNPITKEVVRIIGGRKHYFEVKFIPEKSETGDLQSILGISDDITEKKHAQVEIERINRALRMVSKVNDALTRIHEEQELIESVCEIIVELGGYKLAWVGYVEHDMEMSVIPAAFFGDSPDYISDTKASWDENNVRGQGPAGIVIRTGKVYIINDIDNDPNFKPWKDAATRKGFNSIIALPLSHDGIVFGVLGIYSAETGLFEAKEVELLEEMANNLAFGVYALRIESNKKLAEQKLSRSEKRYRLLLEGLTDYHYSVDINKFEPIVEVKQREAFYAITGYSADNFLTNRDFWYTFIFPDDLELALKYRQATCNGEIVDPVEYRIICKDGSIRWIHDKKILVKDANGVPLSIEGVVKDITLQKRAEEALKRSEERFSKVFRYNPFSLSIYNADELRIVDINKGYTNLTGYSREEVIGRTAEELNLYFDPNEKYEMRKVLKEKGMVENFEFKFRTKSGEILIGLNTTIEIYIGNKKHFFSIVQNITSRKKAETELRKLLMAIEQSPVSVVITDIQGNIEYVNPKFVAVTGYDFKDVKGKNSRFLKSGKLSSEDYLNLWKTISSGKEWFGEFHNKKKNGELFWESASISPVFDSHGLITNYIAVKEDITDKKNTDRKIFNTIIDTEEKERTKFSQELHDGLGPILSTVKLYFQWLAETPEGPRREQIITTGMQNIDDALQTIKEISNRLSPRILKNMGLIAALENLINKINETKKLTINFHYNLDQRLESKIEITIYRIISELLNNTLKHANATKVNLKFIYHLEEMLMNIYYSDNGCGFDFSDEIINTGFGLQNVIQRLKSLDGTIKFKKKTTLMIIDINIPIY